MNIKEQIRAEIDKLYGEYKDKFHQSGDQYHLGLIDGLDMAERVLDTLPEQPVEGLEEEIATWIPAHISGGDDEVWKDTKNAVTEWAGIVARHFAEWQYQKDRVEFAKLKARKWINGYDEGYAKGLDARKEDK